MKCITTGLLLKVRHHPPFLQDWRSPKLELWNIRSTIPPPELTDSSKRGLNRQQCAFKGSQEIHNKLFCRLKIFRSRKYHKTPQSCTVNRTEVSSLRSQTRMCWARKRIQSIKKKLMHLLVSITSQWTTGDLRDLSSLNLRIIYKMKFLHPKTSMGSVQNHSIKMSQDSLCQSRSLSLNKTNSQRCSNL